MNDCAVCGRSFESMASRAMHERWRHPEFSAPASLAHQRRLESSRRWLATQSRSWRWISASNSHAKRHGQPPMSVRETLPEGPCAYCGGMANGWDHVVPLARGGRHEVANLVPACWSCNHRKSATPVDEFAIPARLTLLCGWCWRPVTRSRGELKKVRRYVVCSAAHQSAMRRSPYIEGRA